MELILRAVTIYVVLFLLLRAAGNRPFSQLTAFDLVLLIVIAEATEGALRGQDASLTASVILVTTLVAVDILFSLAKFRWPRIDHYVDGVPVLLIDEGRFLEDNMRRERVDKDDIMEAARLNKGFEDLENVKYAVLERNGRISIIPWR